MAQTIMAHASMASPLWRRSGLAHSGMARSSTALFRYDAFQYGAGPVRRISVGRSSGVALRNIVLNVPRATCHLYHQNKIFQLRKLKN